MSTYVKNYPGGWQPGVGGGTPIAHDKLDNIETQYDCAKGDLDDALNAATGHDHDGVNSKPVSFDDLVDKPDADDLVSGTPEQGDVYYCGASASARLAHGIAGQVLISGGHGADPYWGGVLSTMPFGTGSDGDVTISVDTTLSRDMFYDDLTVNNGITLNTAGYRIFVKGTLTNNGTIQCNGVNGSNSTGAGKGDKGTGASTNSLGGGKDGGDGGVATASGLAGTAATTALGGAAGAGGNGDGGTGGAAGTVTAPTASQFNVKMYSYLALMRTLADAETPYKTYGGAGGGGGAGGVSSTGGGGGGGGGGGTVWIAAFFLVNNGTIQANGGNGGNGYTTGNTGGGAGGGGGTVVLVYATKSVAGTIQALKGTGGAGNGTGTVGADGSAGNIYELLIA